MDIWLVFEKAFVSSSADQKVIPTRDVRVVGHQDYLFQQPIARCD
jgi:hypothetical protein